MKETVVGKLYAVFGGKYAERYQVENAGMALEREVASGYRVFPAAFGEFKQDLACVAPQLKLGDPCFEVRGERAFRYWFSNCPQAVDGYVLMENQSEVVVVDEEPHNLALDNGELAAWFYGCGDNSLQFAFCDSAAAEDVAFLNSHGRECESDVRGALDRGVDAGRAKLVAMDSASEIVVYVADVAYVKRSVEKALARHARMRGRREARRSFVARGGVVR